MSAAPRKRLMLVVGVGRSGTSVFTGIVSQLGWHVPQPEVQADETNPRGFGEPRWVVDFHQRLLRQRHVTNWDGRPAAWKLTGNAGDKPAVVAELREWLAGEFKQSDNVVIKDPRNAWFLPLWRRCAADLGVDISFVTLLRYPTEVLTSARRSYGTWQKDGSRAAGWLNVMLHTEASTRDTKRAFVSYPQLLSDWSTEIARVGDALDIPWMRDLQRGDHPAVDEFIDPGLHRAQVGWDQVDVPASVQSLTERVWGELNLLAEPLADVAGAQKSLDASLRDYLTLYTEAETIAQSSATALKPRKGVAPTGPTGRVDNRRRARFARRIPVRLRRLVPAGLRHRLRGSGG